MNLTQPPTTDPIRIYRYRDGLYAADLLTVAVVHLDLLSWLRDHPGGIGDVCRHFEIHERPTDVMLTLLAANGLLERATSDGRLEVTALAREHLTTGSPFNLTPYYASLKDRPVVHDFLRVLRTDRPAQWGGDRDALDWHAAMETEPFARAFTAAMDCRGVYLAQGLARELDLSPHDRLLDIGGGSGIYACSLAAHFPHLKATVLDQAPVDRIAARLIEERGFSAQVGVTAGNIFTDDLPRGYDVHLFSNVLHDWGMADVRHLLTTSFEALDPGGLLVIHDAFIDARKAGPLPVAEYSSLLMHSTQGKCYSTAEYGSLVGAAGFDAPFYRPTAADRGVMTARKPR
jgi:predicted O-methyltransferase YrrM